MAKATITIDRWTLDALVGNVRAYVRLLDRQLKALPAESDAHFDGATMRDYAQSSLEEAEAALADQGGEPDPAAEAEPVAQELEQEAAALDEVPVYPVHQQPMSRQMGKYGSFWSCHQKTEDGRYCAYRPGKARK